MEGLTDQVNEQKGETAPKVGDVQPPGEGSEPQRRERRRKGHTRVMERKRVPTKRFGIDVMQIDTEFDRYCKLILLPLLSFMFCIITFVYYDYFRCKRIKI